MDELQQFQELQRLVEADLDRLTAVTAGEPEHSELESRVSANLARQEELRAGVERRATQNRVESLRAAAARNGSILQPAGTLPFAANGRAAAAPQREIGGPRDREYLESMANAGHMEIERRRTAEGVESRILDDVGAHFTQNQLSAISTLAYRDAFTRLLRNSRGIQGLGRSDINALNEGADAEGGQLVPLQVLAKISARKPALTGLWAHCEQINATGNRVSYTQVKQGGDIYPTGFRLSMVGDQGQESVGEVEVANMFGAVNIDIWEGILKGAISKSLLEDAAYDVLGWLARKFGETTDLCYDDHLLRGSGLQQSRGLNAAIGATNEPGFVANGHATVLSASGLRKLFFSIPEQYQSNLRWWFNKTSTGLAISEIKDSSGRPLFALGTQSDGLVNGIATQILGLPYAYTPFMPDVAENAFPIGLGDLTAAAFARRVGLSVTIHRDSAFDGKGLVGIYGRVRWGSRLVEPWRIKYLKMAV